MKLMIRLTSIMIIVMTAPFLYFAIASAAWPRFLEIQLTSAEVGRGADIVQLWTLDSDDFSKLSAVAEVETLVGRNSSVLIAFNFSAHSSFSWDAWISAISADEINIDGIMQYVQLPLPGGKSLLEVSQQVLACASFVSPVSGSRALAVLFDESLVVYVGTIDIDDVEAILCSPSGSLFAKCHEKEILYRIFVDNVDVRN